MLKLFCQTSSPEARTDLAGQAKVLGALIFQLCISQHMLQQGKNASSM